MVLGLQGKMESSFGAVNSEQLREAGAQVVQILAGAEGVSLARVGREGCGPP